MHFWGQRKLRWFFVAPILPFLYLPSLGQAGAWVREPFKTSVFLSYGFYETNEVFNRKGEKENAKIYPDPSLDLSLPVDAEYRQHDASLYGELGLPYDFELNFSFPFYQEAQQQIFDSETYTVTGISDMIFGIKYKWFERPWLLSSVRFDLGIPTGSSSKTSTSSFGVTQTIPLGDGEWDYGLRLIGSRSFQKVPMYASAEIGYRFRTIHRGKDDIPWLVEAGYSFFDSSALTLTLQFDGVLALGDLSSQDQMALKTSSAASGTYPNQEFIQIRPGINIMICKGVFMNLNFSWVLDGKNTGAGWSFRGGLGFET